ncbi:MAG: response regulator transcription factor [Chthoniobacteraceae bacterium]
MCILVAATEPGFVASARRALRSESLVVDVVDTADGVLECALSVPYAAVVLDLEMPGARGVDLLKKLRRNQVSAPILALTADTKPEARVEALRFGADDCLAKPALMTEVVARVHALTRRAARKSGDCLEVEDLVLHCDKQRAFRAGRALPLTEREFLALELLVRAHGRVVSAAKLIERLWREEEAPRENFVAVLIMRLRKKVDDGFSQKLVQTERGAGYIIVATGDLRG